MPPRARDVSRGTRRARAGTGSREGVRGRCAHSRSRCAGPSGPGFLRAHGRSPRPRIHARARACLQVRLVDLDDVGSRCLEIVKLLVDCSRVCEGEAPLVVVVVVLRLLRHRERTGHGDLDPPIGDRPQELDVADLDRAPTADRPRDPGDRVRMSCPVEGDSRLFEIHAFERRCEPVGVALPPHLAVGHDVHAGALHVGHGKPRRVVLCLLEVRLGHAPQLACSHARRQAAPEALAIDQPVGLRVAPDDRRRRAASSTFICAPPDPGEGHAGARGGSPWRLHHIHVQPPSTTRLMPFTASFSSRKRDASTTSAIVTSRPIGVRSTSA